MKKIFKCLLKYIFIPALLLLTSCTMSVDDTDSSNNNAVILGTWWWWAASGDEDNYLDFAVGNGVNEIYYYTLEFNNRVGSFIERAGSKGIKVFLLLDKYWYIWDRQSFSGVMDNFFAYQIEAPESRKFAGLHLDVEPHQHPDYSKNVDEFSQTYIDFIVWVCSTYRPRLNSTYEGATIDFDIPCWFVMPVSYKGKRTELYKAVIDEASRVFLMAYKDSAKKSHELAKRELTYAKRAKTPVIVGVETGRLDEDPGASYYGKGSGYFNEQLSELKNLGNHNNFGISIHHIESWIKMTP
ncbi:MAG: hypothetical protein LBH07_07295 [Treponema sp.]|jgi:hypothetical protein|nr:hypothetical protein [Treponema sp.]